MKTYSLFTLIVLLSTLTAATAVEQLKWAWEDENGDGAWNYSVTNANFESVGQQSANKNRL